MHSNNYWQCQKISSLAEDKFGEDALSFSNSKSDKRKNKKTLRKKVVLVYECLLINNSVIKLFLVEPMRIQTTIGSAKKLASFAEEFFF